TPSGTCPRKTADDERSVYFVTSLSAERTSSARQGPEPSSHRSQCSRTSSWKSEEICLRNAHPPRTAVGSTIPSSFQATTAPPLTLRVARTGDELRESYTIIVRLQPPTRGGSPALRAVGGNGTLSPMVGSALKARL